MPEQSITEIFKISNYRYMTHVLSIYFYLQIRVYYKTKCKVHNIYYNHKILNNILVSYTIKNKYSLNDLY